MTREHVDEPPGSLILGLGAAEMAERFREATQRAAEEHLAAGHPVYGSYGAGGVYAAVPDGRSLAAAAPAPSPPPESESRAS